jgi:hypothetical protein
MLLANGLTSQPSVHLAPTSTGEHGQQTAAGRAGGGRCRVAIDALSPEYGPFLARVFRSDFLMGGAENGEGVEVFGGPEGICTEAECSRRSDSGYLPQGRHQPGTYFNWKKRCDGLLPTEMRRLKQLEDENGKLMKRLRSCHWTGRCSRTLSAESFEACPEAQAG